jgi:hypothetical protein
MPVVIDELTSSFEVREEARIREMVREEVKKAIAEERSRMPAATQDDGDVQKRRSDPEP